jgi:hypothetical protein
MYPSFAGESHRLPLKMWCLIRTLPTEWQVLNEVRVHFAKVHTPSIALRASRLRIRKPGMRERRRRKW